MADKNIESESVCKLFIGGLNSETSEDTLRDYFEHWGEIVDCVVMKEPGSRRSRGFGFVTFKKAHMVDDAQKARPHKIDNKVVETKRATPREASNKLESHMTCTKAYISGIRSEHNEDDLGSYFSKFGNIESVEIIVDHVTNEKRGFAFVTFTDYDSVDKIVLLKSHSINGFRCDARKALSKEEMSRLKSSDEPSERRGRGRGGFESRGGFGRGGFEERRGYRGRESSDNRDKNFSSREVGFGNRGGRGYSSRGGGYAGRGGGYASRDEEFGNRDGGFAHRDDFRVRQSPGGHDNFGGREGFGGREEFGNRSNFGGRDSFGGREGFGDRERFVARDEFSGRDSRYERDSFSRRGGREEFEGRASYGGREAYGAKEAYSGRDNYDGEWGSGDYGNRDRDDRFGREELRGSDGYGPDRGFGNGSGGGGAGNGFGNGSEDYDARQGSGFGTGYGSSRGGGPVKENTYKTRSAGPYGGGYGSTGVSGGGRGEYSDLGTADGRDGAGFGGASREAAGFGSGREGVGFGGSGADYDERFGAPKTGFSRGVRGGAGVRGGGGGRGASRGGFDRW